MGRVSKDKKIDVVNIRMVKEPAIYSEKAIKSPSDAIEVIAKELSDYDREVFAVLNLKSSGVPINFNVCSVGTLDSSMVSPREVFKSCILSNATGFIAIHNHPSGNLKPSKEDEDVTERLLECSRIIGIKMLDHIIVSGSDGSSFSFKENGMI